MSATSAAAVGSAMCGRWPPMPVDVLTQVGVGKRPSVKKRVLFLCIHNTARSQMAEAFFNQLCGEGEFEAQSAGVEPGKVDPLAVEVMKEVGIDVSAKQARAVWDLVKGGEMFSYVVTLCDEATERRPIFPGVTKRFVWSFPDPSRFEGPWELKLAKTRQVRDQIKRQVEEWCNNGVLRQKTIRRPSTRR
jgi:arsenate reductase